MIDPKSWQLLNQIVNKHVATDYKVFVFGSRVRNSHRKYSDIDLGIWGKKPVSHKIMGKLESELEESDLPYRVDVVDFTVVDDQFKQQALKEVKWLRK